MAFVKVKPGLQRLHVPGEAPEQKRIVFLAGFPRSGANIVVDVFEWSSQTHVLRQADPGSGNDRVELLNDADLSERVRGCSARSVLVKALLDGHRLGELLALFPNSRAVWVYRHYADSVTSILQRWPEERNGIDALARLGSRAAGWRGQGMTDATWGLLSMQYSPDWNDATANAWFWYLRHQLFFDHGFDANSDVMLVRYESLLFDPERVIQPIAELAGVPLTPVMASVPHERPVQRHVAPDIAPEVRALCDDMQARLDRVWADRSR
jgi:hypothetical protein